MFLHTWFLFCLFGVKGVKGTAKSSPLPVLQKKDNLSIDTVCGSTEYSRHNIQNRETEVYNFHKKMTEDLQNIPSLTLAFEVANNKFVVLEYANHLSNEMAQYF